MVTTRSIPAVAAAIAALSLAAAIPAAVPASAQGRSADKAQSFTVEGIHVILAPSSNELVSVVIGFEGGVASGETDNPALSDFTADVAAASGSRTISKDALRQFLSETSTNLGGSGDLRGITYSMTATRSNFNRAWEMLASIINEPVIDELEFRNAMQRRIADVKRRWSSPEGYASFIADSLVKMKNPVLGKIVQEGDVARVDVATMKGYLTRITERSRMLVVIVGNVSQNDVKKKLAAFAHLPLGSYKPVTIPSLEPAPSPTIEVVDRQGSPTTYVQGSFPGPRADEDSYWSMQVGLFHLRNILFEELRTKRNLTYAPGSSLSSTLGHSRGVISVSSTLPDSSIVIMYNELEKMRRGEINETELNSSKQVFTTIFYTRQMTSDGVANALYSAQRNAGDWRRAFSIDAISSVTKESVRRVFEQYARNLQVGIVGRKDKVTPEKYIFRESPPRLP